jgi:ribonuclease Y
METTSILIGTILVALGAILGYFARQEKAKRDLKTIEAKIEQLIQQKKKEAQDIINSAKEKARQILKEVEREEEQKRRAILKREELLLERENLFDKKVVAFEKEKAEFNLRVEKLQEVERKIKEKEKEIEEKLQKIATLTKEEAKKEIMLLVEKEYEKEIAKKMEELEKEGEKKLEERAKEILASVIQRISVPQVQEMSTTVVFLPSEEMKSRIIGKEGRNIRTFEKLTGVELIVDESPEVVTLSCFDPIRREIARIALENLIKDSRIQPARIEEMVEKAKEEVQQKIKKAGETAVYELGILDLDPKLVHLLGRLAFRTSYGQNVLLHSIEVAYLASALAHEIGADAFVCKKAGLLHDIGKAVDHEIEGSHVEIGVKILEKFGVEKEVIEAVKLHHEDIPDDKLEAIIVQVADKISGSRPGARKDTVENYIKRLEELEDLACSFEGVKNVWALQAGREIRVFVKPEEIDDFGAKKLAKEIAKKIEEELKYPGEIKVTVIRELRVVEYAR